jgi:hypothetical protein
VPYSAAVGVGNVCACTDNPNSFAEVRGAEGGRGYDIPFDTIPERGQVSENVAEAHGKVACDVFQQDEARSNVANGSRDCRPHVPRIVESGSAAGDGEGLARVARGDDVDIFDLGIVDGVRVFVARRVGEVFSENAPAPRIDLDLPARDHSRALEPEIPPADPGAD